jgi:hypothetical protein
MAIGDSNADLQQLVDDIVDNARQLTGRYDLTIEWDLDGDAPAGGNRARHGRRGRCHPARDSTRA